MEINKNIPSKLDMNRNAEELKVYMFTIQNEPTILEIPEDFKAVMAYNNTEAINMIRKFYPIGTVITMKERARLEVRKIIDVVNLKSITPKDSDVIITPPPTKENTTPQDLGATVTPPASKEKTAQDFVYGLMMVADRYITNKRDQTSLKRILGKIKI